MKCERAWEADALEEGNLLSADVASYERHCRTCAQCSARVSEGQRLRRLLDRVESPEAPEIALRRVRGKVLRDVRRHSLRQEPRRVAWLLASVIVVAAAVGVVWRAGPRANGGSPPTQAQDSVRFAAQVTASPSARWSRTRQEGVETVRLDEGELELSVRKQTDGERFLVTVPDGQLEVRGTRFQVNVDGGATTHIAVTEGLVAWRPSGGEISLLGAGQAWDREEAKAPKAPPVSANLGAPRPAPAGVTAGPAPVARRVAAEAPAPHASSAPPPAPLAAGTSEALDYEQALALYREGRFLEAAEGFRKFSASHARSDLLEDSTFLEAVSLTRSGHADAGAIAAARHLAQFPRSFHAKEAALLVARAARDRGDCAGARDAFRPWPEGAADPAIAEALGSCR